MAQQLDFLANKGAFHMMNAVLEGSIGVFHLFFPNQVYRRSMKPIPGEQVLLGRFLGALMISMALISYRSKDRSVAKGFACYHTLALILSTTWGVGIDGTKKQARDTLHAVAHATLALGFSWMVFRGRRQALDGGRLTAPWVRINDTLQLDFVARDWKAVMDVLEEYSRISEKMNHHPDITISDYRHVRVVVRTHSKNGEYSSEAPTEKDFELARELEKVPIDASEKWLKEPQNFWVIRKKHEHHAS